MARLLCPSCGSVFEALPGWRAVCPGCGLGCDRRPLRASLPAPLVALAAAGMAQPSPPGGGPARPASCPQCGGDGFTFVKRGYSWGAGAAGGALGAGAGAAIGVATNPCYWWVGPIVGLPLGAMAGGIGANRMLRVCTGCGRVDR